MICFYYRCWLQEEFLWYGFLLPISIILIINLVIYIRIIVEFYRYEPQTGKNIRASQLFAAIAITILMGLTWLIGFVLVPTGNVVFQYLFSVFNSLQGFLIFVLFITKDKRVRNVWKDFLMRKLRTKVVSISTDDM